MAVVYGEQHVVTLGLAARLGDYQITNSQQSCCQDLRFYAQKRHQLNHTVEPLLMDTPEERTTAI